MQKKFSAIRGHLLAVLFVAAACGDDASSATSSETEGATESSSGDETRGETGAAVCGDGLVQGDEECDGENLEGASCASLPGFGGGALACTRECTFDVSDCRADTCGNAAIDGAEECDGSNLGGQNCASLGFDGGTLACSEDCTFDESGCQIFSCGNGVIEGREQCEGADLDGKTCISEGFSAGTLACTANCLLDTSGCQPCGDGMIQGDEECDGADLGGATCLSQGFEGGTLGCSATCQLDTSGCGATDCCEEKFTPGCTDATCEAVVCGNDSFCCDSEWDDLCVGAAEELCAVCGGGGPGNCCIGNGTPGCEEQTCETAVCDQDAFCCQMTWDAICAGWAAELCPACEPVAGDCCTPNGTPGCEDGDCQAVVCAADAFCCDTEWDGLCAAAAAQLCVQCAGENCCVANGTPGCEDATCEQAVCLSDPSCCDTAWDSVCAAAAIDICEVCDLGNDCCYANGTTGCEDTTCEAVVCAQDAFCCDTEWDGECAAMAGELCLVCGGSGEDCCIPNGTPGCSEVTCQTAVCAVDAFCCETEWDEQCAGLAETTCAECIAANSCEGNCGGAAPNCYCDDECVGYGDCCADACALCGHC